MNKIVHFEIPAKNYQRAKEFYSKLFDWKIEEWAGAGEEYKYGLTTAVPSDENGIPTEVNGINGAIMEATRMVEPVVITIEVDSIVYHLLKIIDMGGKVLMPRTPVGDMGYAARFKDPEGNIIGLWENKK